MLPTIKIQVGQSSTITSDRPQPPTIATEDIRMLLVMIDTLPTNIITTDI